MEAGHTNLKIAQVIDVFENAINGGGISTQRFTKLLRQQGHRVILIANGEEATDKVALRSYYPPIPFTKRILKRMKFVFAKPDEAKMSGFFLKWISFTISFHCGWGLQLCVLPTNWASRLSPHSMSRANR